MITFLEENGVELLLKLWEHFYISFIAIALGVLVAVPLGILLTRVPKLAGIVIRIVSFVQTFPSLAILAFFIPLLGVGKFSAIVALFVYSILPILRNTYTSVKDVDASLLEAGKGMGMTNWERIRDVELPMSVPVIMAGIRVSTVYLIGWATLASFVGAGGLGDYIFFGLSLLQTDFIIGGAVPVTLLAVCVDLLLGRLENKLSPEGIKASNTAA